ncbi:MAG: MarR family transcriptional regulator [Verrucomicrobiota bacterium]|jgi:DNA-binding MarR family transcriptional regulator
MKVKSESPGPRYPALMHLLRTAENLWNASRAFFGRWDLSPSQFNVLNLLLDQPEGLSQVRISRQLVMHRSNVTGLIDRLEKRGLLQRHSSPGDRRSYRVILTPAGSDLLAQILPDYYRLAEEVWGALPVDRTKRLLADLSHLDANLARLEQSLAATP